MAQRKQGLLKWMMNNLSSVQKHLLSVVIMTVGLVILIWMVVTQMNAQLRVVNTEIYGLNYQERLRDFLRNVYTHKYLSLRYSEGKYAIKEQMLNLQKEANDDLRSFQRTYKDLHKNVGSLSSEFAIPRREEVTVQEVDKLWKTVRHQSFEQEVQERASSHEGLMIGIYSLLDYGVSVSALHMDPNFVVFQLVNTTAGRLPKLQSRIDHLATLISHNQERLSDEVSLEVVGQIAIIRHELELMEVSVSWVFNTLSDRKDLVVPIFESYIAFLQLANEFLESVDEGGDVLSLASRTINQSFVFWDEASDSILEFLKERRASINTHKWIVILSSLIFIVVAFALGHYFAKERLKQLRYLKQTAMRLGKGELTARVPIHFHDELGKVCMAFNRMAMTVEQMVNQFHALRQATQRLAGGDFTARVQVDEHADEEVQEVAETFNTMAESFESVVSRLHRLVIDLTSSATQIAASSKQQEAIISEQGATTKQISVTATEISATSKDFANMIHEVGVVAEDTSRVALRGQTNLGKMVKAMRNMEEAADSIASRLKDLNEKASNITGISTTISEVSKQTHLLSLNAAIQAEKAGEAGRSFAVIAREIRTLADQTAMSTLDIEKIVTEIADAIRSSVMGVDDFTTEIRRGADQVQSVSSQLNQIISQVKILVDCFERVDMGMKNQSEAAEQINTALIELTQMANETSISMSQFFSTIEGLDRAALDLRGTLEKI
jgi:methyl-accepting chemotaxis protein WspA